MRYTEPRIIVQQKRWDIEREIKAWCTRNRIFRKSQNTVMDLKITKSSCTERGEVKKTSCITVSSAGATWLLDPLNLRPVGLAALPSSPPPPGWAASASFSPLCRQPQMRNPGIVQGSHSQIYPVSTKCFSMSQLQWSCCSFQGDSVASQHSKIGQFGFALQLLSHFQSASQNRGTLRTGRPSG